MAENQVNEEDNCSLIIGIDDSGRGPVLGPMIVAAVLLEDNKEEELKKEGVKDSKQVLHPLRIKLSSLIKETALATKEIVISPKEIDTAVFDKSNLNTLEARKMAELVNIINTKERQKDKITVIVDCPSVNIKAWRNKFMSFLSHSNNLNIVCEHKADVNHPVVSAASILAKVRREDEVDKIKMQFHDLGNLGSGYPSDPITKEFLKKHGKTLNEKGHIRTSWSTWIALFPEEAQEIKQKKQSTLKDFNKIK